jgi:hypothetical protein
MKRLTYYFIGTIFIMCSLVTWFFFLGRPAGFSEVEQTVPLEPLTVNKTNPRYFGNGIGNSVYLTGSHTWANLQDIEGVQKSFRYSSFNYSDYLSFLSHHNHNFFRLWVWEQATWLSTIPGKLLFSPLPYLRTGPGKAIDDNLKFDLTKFNQSYFDRLRSRVEAAGKKGIYVSVMLFNGFSIERKSEKDPGGNPWDGHPFNISNNINGVDGDPALTGNGRAIHTLGIPIITALQETYIRKVIDTVHDLDNVLYEIANESHVHSTKWQYHMIDYIHKYEASKGARHPVLMTAQWPEGTNEVLFKSPAEAICPNEEGGYKENPPAGNGRKVILSDTDHLWGIGGDYRWVWKSFLRGLNPIYMDTYNLTMKGSENLKYDLALVRKNMGYTNRLAKRMNMAGMTPRPDLVSTKYCLASPGKEYVAYAPGGSITIDLSGASSPFHVEWLNPLTGKIKNGNIVNGGSLLSMTAPFGGDAVLYIYNLN